MARIYSYGSFLGRFLTGGLGGGERLRFLDLTGAEFSTAYNEVGLFIGIGDDGRRGLEGGSGSKLGGA
ncbi:hypothetical protein PLEOSDRAFT_1090429 [Pleurotus ostreatus PC15]|uniref:Uncharacterized protein n=1 Tax=Pleurotus ostreatus (strain PC15) TaxID=1137138 RepID=A0A067NKT4_PLEO1|nr:hypothetical protein PLEOSDRAFT_1090429 [Pleurotus ostreatus PC15]